MLQLRCGKTDGTDGNTYTFSNLKIEECAFRYTQTPEVKKVTTLDTQNGYIEKLDVTRDKATVRIEKTPATAPKFPWTAAPWMVSWMKTPPIQ